MTITYDPVEGATKVVLTHTSEPAGIASVGNSTSLIAPGYRIPRWEVDASTLPMFPILVLSSIVSPA